jgi:hypothetical protein
MAQLQRYLPLLFAPRRIRRSPSGQITRPYRLRRSCLFAFIGAPEVKLLVVAAVEIFVNGLNCSMPTLAIPLFGLPPIATSLLEYPRLYR